MLPAVPHSFPNYAQNILLPLENYATFLLRMLQTHTQNNSKIIYLLLIKHDKPN